MSGFLRMGAVAAVAVLLVACGQVEKGERVVHAQSAPVSVSVSRVDSMRNADLLDDIERAFSQVVDSAAEFGASLPGLNCPNSTGYFVETFPAYSLGRLDDDDLAWCQFLIPTWLPGGAAGLPLFRVQNRSSTTMTIGAPTLGVYGTLQPGQYYDIPLLQPAPGTNYRIPLSVTPTNIASLALEQFLPQPPMLSFASCVQSPTLSCFLGQLGNLNLPSVRVGSLTVDLDTFVTAASTVLQGAAIFDQLGQMEAVSGELDVTLGYWSG